MSYLFNQLMEFFNGQMSKPLPYLSFSKSWFHYLSLGVVVLLTTICVIRMKDVTDKQWKRFTLIFAIILLIFEVYKQLNFSYASGWSYQWYAFPFQFCSTPMYVALIAALVKPGRFQDALYTYLATFGLFAGVMVMLIPNDVFVTTVGINIQTMVHHGGMVMMGVVALHKVHSRKQVLSAIMVFSVVVLIASLLNVIHNTWIQDGTFNMFFINPIYRNHLPVLSLIQPLVPYFVFLAIYTLGFSLAAYLTLAISLMFKNHSLQIVRQILHKHSISSYK